MNFKVSLNKISIILVIFTLFSCNVKDESGWKIKDDVIPTNCNLPDTELRPNGVAIGGFPRHPDRLNSNGTINATVIMVDFPDFTASVTNADAYAMISGATARFTDQSYSRMTYTMTPINTWFRMSKNSSEYDFDTNSGHKAYIEEAVALADASVDFSNTDSLIILATPNATTLTKGPAFSQIHGGGVTVDGNEILNVATSGYDLNSWGSIWLNHEVGHNMGLVDLYASTVTNSSDPWNTLRYTGQFSYMGYNSSNSNSPGLTAWERWLLGWLDDEQIVCKNPVATGDFSQVITPIESSGGIKAVVIPINSTKAIVVESRRALGIDASMAKTGALVYTVDSSIDSSMGPIQVYPVTSDTRYIQSIRSAGESVRIGRINIRVSSSTDTGDTVDVTLGGN
jgi:M6 family metalloprotease-like protein